MRIALRVGVVTAAIALLATLIWVPRADAGINRNLCTTRTERLQVADNFVLEACFDGTNLYLKNSSIFPFNVSSTGSASTPYSYNPGGIPPLPSVMLQLAKPGEFNLVSPGYGLRIPVGKDGANFRVDNSAYARQYALMNFLDKKLPLPTVVSVGVALVYFGDELWKAWKSYQGCAARSRGYWSDVACEGYLTRDTAVAIGRFAAAFLKSPVKVKGFALPVKEVVAFLKDAAWFQADIQAAAVLARGSRTLHVAPEGSGPAAPPAVPRGPAPKVDPASGIAGSRFSVTMSAVCPKATRGYEWAGAELDFLDVNGERIAGESSSTEGDPSVTKQTFGVTVPYEGRYYYENDAPAGASSVRTRCVQGGPSAQPVDTRIDEPAAFTVTGPSQTMRLSTTSGPVGTTVTVRSDAPCPGRSNLGRAVSLAAIPLASSGDQTMFHSGGTSRVSPDGNWVETITVPPGTESGTYALEATCFVIGSSTPPALSYRGASFNVTAPR